MLKVLGTAVVVFSAAASVSFAAGLPSRSINGNYIEARTADVYTGPCFANGEIEMAGKEAVMGWKINQGDWHGVNLEGLSVVGVLRAEHTLGNTFEKDNPTRAVLIVDSRANAEQRLALQSFAKYMGGDLMKNVVKVSYAPIELTVESGRSMHDGMHGDGVQSGAARLTAGSLAAIRTRAMTEMDHICGNEEIWYPPLAKVQQVTPAYSLEDAYHGDALGETWNNRLKRSGFVGTFQVAAE